MQPVDVVPGRGVGGGLGGEGGGEEEQEEGEVEQEEWEHLAGSRSTDCNMILTHYMDQ